MPTDSQELKMFGQSTAHQTKGKSGGARGFWEEDPVMARACSRPLNVFNINGARITRCRNE